jgi:hypothetical protein
MLINSLQLHAQSELLTSNFSPVNLGLYRVPDPASSETCIIGEPSLCETNDFIATDQTLVLGGSGYSDSYSLVQDLGTNIIEGQNVLLEGFFLVDKDLVFRDCNIKATGGILSHIYVGAGGEPSSIEFETCNLFSCSTIWRGITVNGQSGIAMSKCEIQDARFAIELDSDKDVTPAVPCSPRVILQGVTFDRNYVGIYCVGNDDNTTILPTLLFSRVNNCVFKVTGYLLEDGGGVVGAPDYSVGIYLDNATMTLGASGNINYCAEFYCLSNGIQVAASNVKINGKCRFSNSIISKSSNSLYPDQGHGILATNGSDVRVGLFQPSIFQNNVNTGVFSLESHLRVNNCSFEGNLFGVAALANLLPRTIYITDNTIDINRNGRVGILAERSPSANTVAPRLIIRNNTIQRKENNTFAGDPFGDPRWMAGIIVQMNAPNTTDECFILDNTYTDYTEFNNGWIDDVGMWITSGITPGASNKLTFSGNIINYDNGNPQSINKNGFFFYMPASSGMKIIKNEINGTEVEGGGHENFGFTAFGSPNTLFCTNKVNQVGTGIRFRSDNNPSYLKTSDIGACSDVGLTLLSTIIGEQNYYNNTWVLEPDAYGIFAAAADLASSQESPFLVDQTFPNTYPLGDLSPASGWFFDLSGDESGCYIGSGSGGNEFSPTITNTDRRLFDGTIDDLPGFDAYTLWQQKVNLLYKLSTHPELLVSDTEAQAYHTAAQGSEEARTVTTQLELLAAYTQPAVQSYLLAMNALESSYDQVLVQSTPLEQQFETTNGLSDDEASDLLAQWHTIHANAMQQSVAVRPLETAMQQSLITAFAATLASDAQYVPQTPTMAADQVLRTAMLQRAVQGDMDANTKAQIQSLTTAPEATAGIFPMLARLLVEPTVSKPDQQRFASVRTNKPVTSAPALSSGKVFPNPAHDRLTISTDKTLTGQWFIMDLYGHTQLTGTAVDQRFLSVDTKRLAAGQYIFSAVNTDGSLVQIRFAIVH